MSEPRENNEGIDFNILIINPGSTSTKIGGFNNDREVINYSKTHDKNELNCFKSVIDQVQFRLKRINDFFN